jgi:hypothetical protein
MKVDVNAPVPAGEKKVALPTVGRILHFIDRYDYKHSFVWPALVVAVDAASGMYVVAVFKKGIIDHYEVPFHEEPACGRIFWPKRVEG